MIEKFGAIAYTFWDYYTAEDASEEKVRKALLGMKKAGYDEIQLAALGKFSIEQWSDFVKEADLTVMGTHWDHDEMLDNTEEAIRKHKEYFDTDTMGFVSLPIASVLDKKELFAFLDKFNKMTEIVKKHNFKITMHNHHWEFYKVDGKKTAMDYFMEETDPEVAFSCFDTYWAQYAGVNPTEFIKKYAGRIDVLHMKDMKLEYTPKEVMHSTCYGPMITEIGNGNLNWHEIVKASVESGVNHFCVEQDVCPGDPVDSLKISADYIKANFVK